jgi:RNA polymerase sigma factor (TIGR02999 family)
MDAAETEPPQRDPNADGLGTLEPLIREFYGELKRLARGHLRRESCNHALGTTSLVHECYLRLRQSNLVSPENRAHFFGAATRAMRQILVDHARSRSARKRGPGLEVNIEPLPDFTEEKAALVLAVDDSLKSLSVIDPIQANLIEMRFFGGLSAEESAEALQISVNVARRELRVAQAWLRREVGPNSIRTD